MLPGANNEALFYIFLRAMFCFCIQLTLTNLLATMSRTVYNHPTTFGKIGPLFSSLVGKRGETGYKAIRSAFGCKEGRNLKRR